MPELMNHVEFRTALENAIKGKSANKAPFSIAWASGKLSRAHLGKPDTQAGLRWGRLALRLRDQSGVQRRNDVKIYES